MPERRAVLTVVLVALRALRPLTELELDQLLERMVTASAMTAHGWVV